jgi:hypothetical protein
MSFRETLTKVRVITRNGEFEFENIVEARQRFPTLDVNRGCRNFTEAKQDNDYLVFEAWEIHDSYLED